MVLCVSPYLLLLFYLGLFAEAHNSNGGHEGLASTATRPPYPPLSTREERHAGAGEADAVDEPLPSLHRSGIAPSVPPGAAFSLDGANRAHLLAGVPKELLLGGARGVRLLSDSGNADGVNECCPAKSGMCEFCTVDLTSISCVSDFQTMFGCSYDDAIYCCQSVVDTMVPSPVHGKWSKWGTCTELCGAGGTQTRQCTPPTNGGNECSGGEGPRACDPAPGCPENCWASWGGWGSCTAACGKSGSKYRTRSRDTTKGGSVQCTMQDNQATDQTQCTSAACAPDPVHGPLKNCPPCALYC